MAHRATPPSTGWRPPQQAGLRRQGPEAVAGRGHPFACARRWAAASPAPPGHGRATTRRRFLRPRRRAWGTDAAYRPPPPPGIRPCPAAAPRAALPPAQAFPHAEPLDSVRAPASPRPARRARRRGPGRGRARPLRIKNRRAPPAIRDEFSPSLLPSLTSRRARRPAGSTAAGRTFRRQGRQGETRVTPSATIPTAPRLGAQASSRSRVFPPGTRLPPWLQRLWGCRRPGPLGTASGACCQAPGCQQK